MPVNSHVLRLLSAQAGAITRGQALALGMTPGQLRRRVVEGEWRRLVRGCFLATPNPDWTSFAWAGVLVGGETAVLGGLAAAHLHRLAPQPDWPVAIHVSRQVRVEPQPWWEFRRAPRRGVGDPPRTRVEDTLLDCWGELDEEAAMALVGKALSDRRTSVARLREELRSRGRVPRRAALAELLGDALTGVRSPLERRYLREVERRHGLPEGRRQVRSQNSRILDVLYEDFGVIVELDGRLGHAGTDRFRDMARDNGHLVGGLLTLRYGYGDVSLRPCAVAAQVGSLLASRGWTGTPGCPACAMAA